jgi:hypothetical protein
MLKSHGMSLEMYPHRDGAEVRLAREKVRLDVEELERKHKKDTEH